MMFYRIIMQIYVLISYNQLIYTVKYHNFYTVIFSQKKEFFFKLVKKKSYIHICKRNLQR